MSDHAVPREQIVGARLENNLDDVLAHGPRLSANRSTWIEARCSTGLHVLRGGLGAMGVGTMWFNKTQDDEADPTWATAPVVDSEQCGACSRP